MRGTTEGEARSRPGAHRHEDKVLLILTLIIGAVVGLPVVLFIVLTENLGGRLYPAASPAWRRVLIPIAGSLLSGFLLHRYFPMARGSGIPQTKAALFLNDGYIPFRTEAKLSLARKASPRSFSDEADATVALAERIWAGRGSSCRAPEDDPIAIVLAKAAR